MNSVGDEAVRSELLMRLKNISTGSGSSGGAHTRTHEMRSLTGVRGGKGTASGASKNPYIEFLQLKKRGTVPKTMTYAKYKSVKKAPEIMASRIKMPSPADLLKCKKLEKETGIKYIGCRAIQSKKMKSCKGEIPATVLNPRTKRLVKTSNPIGLRIYKSMHPEKYIINPKSGRYMCIHSKNTLGIMRQAVVDKRGETQSMIPKNLGAGVADFGGDMCYE
jgi:hypothetical protein